MNERKTIRPVTLKRVIEVCSLVREIEDINYDLVSKKLEISFDRSREIILEMVKMGLLNNANGGYKGNHNSMDLLQKFEKEKFLEIHKYFFDNYEFYRNFINILLDFAEMREGLTSEEIERESFKCELNLNQTAIDVLSDWCDRLGIIQRHLFANRFYFVKSEGIPLEAFKKSLVNCYLSISLNKIGMFVDVPELREEVCERSKVSRNFFDDSLRTLYLKNLGKIEMSGAPITTIAKKSPLSEKKMRLESKALILSPRFEIKKEREGLLVGNKSYYYVAIYDLFNLST